MTYLNQTTPDFDNEENIDDNCVRLDNKTAYGLNVLYQLMMRGNQKQAMRALQEIRLSGRIFDSERFFQE